MTRTIAIVTGEDAPNLTEDGRRLAEAFRDWGFAAEPVVWTDTGVDWGTFDVALLRSCWKYYARLNEFRELLDALEQAETTLLNPPAVVRWNLHKSYLLDLEARGVPVVPTELVERTGDRSLEAILRERGWDEAVIKPVVGTSSAGVWKTTVETAADDQDRFESRFSAARRNGDRAAATDDGERLSERGALVQQFAPEVADGERSLVFFAGEYSHAWRSLGAPDELGVDANFDGSPRRYDPPAELIERAAGALRVAGEILDVEPARLPYVRVDCIIRDEEFRLMELELVEPYLDLGSGEEAAESLVSAVESAIEG